MQSNLKTKEPKKRQCKGNGNHIFENYGDERCSCKAISAFHKPFINYASVIEHRKKAKTLLKSLEKVIKQLNRPTCKIKGVK